MLYSSPEPLKSTDAMTSASGWTFITNHGLVLSYLAHNPRNIAREIVAGAKLKSLNLRSSAVDTSLMRNQTLSVIRAWEVVRLFQGSF